MRCRTPRADIWSWLHQAANAWQTSSPSKPLRLQKVYLDFSECKKLRLNHEHPSTVILGLAIWCNMQVVQARHSSGRQKQSMLLQPFAGDSSSWELVARRNAWNTWNDKDLKYSAHCAAASRLFCLSMPTTTWYSCFSFRYIKLLFRLFYLALLSYLGFITQKPHLPEALFVFKLANL